MPVPQALVTRYFQLIVNRQFTEAERELERIKQKMHKTEYNRGYFRALYGMLLTRKTNSNDSYAFFSKIDLSDKRALHAYRREFQEHERSRLHGDFDRGYFSAWANCMRILSRIEIPEALNNTNHSKEIASAEEAEQTQATMEGFLKEEEA